MDKTTNPKQYNVPHAMLHHFVHFVNDALPFQAATTVNHKFIRSFDTFLVCKTRKSFQGNNIKV